MAKKRTTAEEAAQKIVDAIKSHPETLRNVKDIWEDIQDEAKERAKEIDETLSYFGTSREELTELTSHLSEERQIEFTQEVYTALKNYKESEEEPKSRTIDELLEYFRFKVGKFGYYPLIDEDKDLIPIVAAYGSVRDKTALAINAHFDFIKDHPKEKPILSRAQANEIRKSIGVLGEKYREEFVGYLIIYDTFNNTKGSFYRAKYKFFACGLTAVAYFNTYEWLGKAEELFNSFAPLVDPNKKEEFKRLTDEYNDYLQNYQTFGELENVSGDNWIDKKREDCLEFATATTETLVRNSLAEFKGTIAAFKKWIKDNDAEIFAPIQLKRELLLAERLCYLRELQGKYYKSFLKEIEKRGDEITEQDKKLAVFPEWEDVEPNQKIEEIITREINDYRETHK